MFDIGFSELMVIGIVALIVIGPERLPKVARTLGHLFGRMQRYVNDVKADISREIELDELRKLQTSMQDAARSFEQSVNREVNAAESELQSLAREADPSAPRELPGASDRIEPVLGAAPEKPATADAAAPGSSTQMELDIQSPATPNGKRA